ncbi:Hypothetical protein SRAE_2000213750 [Strongyloides ratti]|uniref:Basic-leucine zipper domain-containing protein n=1 Tax=Strongyloides ratti TaxID=34506 RepID=A0A090LIY3_STRRB|nr:Hypothetical protein SRAE_2000213750 [Strongyloides ratti]CEF67475.1 Hypothetical protein SRAE_2000213750 [Strongyloides ratti]
MVSINFGDNYHHQKRKYTFKSEDEKNADPDYRKKRDRNNILSWKAKQKKAILIQNLLNENKINKEKLEIYKRENMILWKKFENLFNKLIIEKKNLDISNNYIKILEKKLDQFNNYFNN